MLAMVASNVISFTVCRLSPEMREQAGIEGNRVKIEVVDGKIVISKETE